MRSSTLNPRPSRNFRICRIFTNCKVVVRNARRDAVELLKKAVKNEGLPEDGQKEGEEEVQKVTDKNVKEIDALIAAKEKDIMTV